MSKQAAPPPPGDKPAPPAPPPPPGWRHWLLPAGTLAALLLWIALPAVHQAPATSLSYSWFLTDVAAHKVKTVTVAQAGGTSSGTLTGGTDYTVVIRRRLARNCSVSFSRAACRSPLPPPHQGSEPSC
jgi:cell division protease FtsH